MGRTTNTSNRSTSTSGVTDLGTTLPSPPPYPAGNNSSSAKPSSNNAVRTPPVPTRYTTNSPVRLSFSAVNDFKDRRVRRRVSVQPMYTSAIVRVLAKKEQPLEGHVTNLSETGMMVEVDEQIAIGQPVTVEFSVAGLGRAREESWPTFAVAAEVVRLDDVADFPQGPYKTALRFVRISTMVQAQIARFVATQPDKIIVKSV